MPGGGERDRRDQRDRDEPEHDQVQDGRPQRVRRLQRVRAGRGRRGDDVQHRRGGPARAPRVGDGPAHRRDLALLVQPGPHRHDCHGHADGEPHEEVRQPQAHLRVPVRHEHEDHVDEGERPVHADRAQQPLRPHAGVARRDPLGVPGQQRRGQRQQGVPADLDDQAPCLPDPGRAEAAAPPRVRKVRLRERQQRSPSQRVAEMRARGRDHEDDDQRPVRGHDPQRALEQVPADARSGPPVQHRRRPRAVQQQAGEREEDRHADLAAVEQPTRAALPGHGPRGARHVERQDGQRRERPDAVQRVLVPGDRRRGGPGGLRRRRPHGPVLRSTSSRFQVAISRRPGTRTIPDAQRGR